MTRRRRFLGSIALGTVLTLASLAIASELGGSTGAGGGPDALAEPGLVVFHGADEAGQGGYFVADPRSGRTSRVTAVGVDVDPGAVGPTGDWAAVPCAPGTLETSEDASDNVAVCRVDLTTGSRLLIVDTGQPVQHPTSSPNGDRIVFAAGGEADHGLKATPMTGGSVESLCDGFCPLYRFSEIVWSPDGTKVAFVASTPGSGGHMPQIHVVTVGRSDYTRLTNTRGMEADPAWSPDGSKIAFSSARSGDTEIWVMNADGSDHVQLTAHDGIDVDPSWSPDGASIVYSRLVDGSWDLAVIAAEGGEPVGLTSLPGSETRPLWLSAGSVPGS